MTSSNPWTDGNALAGPVYDLFRVEVTTAIGCCAGCGRTAAMAEVRGFDHAPGVVARCPTSDHVLLRMVHDPGPAAPSPPRSPQSPPRPEPAGLMGPGMDLFPADAAGLLAGHQGHAAPVL